MIDKLDREIVQILQVDGRQNFVDIAKMMGVTEGTIRKRVKSLLDDNIIKVMAITNPAELGYTFTGIIGLQINMKNLRSVLDSLRKIPNIVYLAYVTGRYDLMAIILTKSTEELSDLIEKEISPLPAVIRTETFITLDVIKGGWPCLETSQLVTKQYEETSENVKRKKIRGIPFLPYGNSQY